ncbi:hypothetical protein LTR65_000535 [Meristemomyces frigidus]
MPMNNAHMRDIFRCTDPELTDLKNAFKFQMETNFVNGQAFLGQLPSEVDDNGEIRERMWGALMTTDRRFLEMLKGRRWEGHKPADFDVRLRQAKNKICGDLTNEKRRRQRPVQRDKEIKLEAPEGSETDIPASDRRLRKKRAISYDLQQMRIFGGDERPEGSVASTSPSSRQLRTRPSMFSNVSMPFSAIDGDNDDEQMRSPELPAGLRIRYLSESPLFEPEEGPFDPMGFGETPLLASDLMADSNAAAARRTRSAASSPDFAAKPSKHAYRPALHRVDESAAEGPAPQSDDSDSSVMMVDGTRYDGARSPTSDSAAGPTKTSRSLRSTTSRQRTTTEPRRLVLRPASQPDDESLDGGPLPRNDDSDGSNIVVATPNETPARAVMTPTPSTVNTPNARSTKSPRGIKPKAPAKRQPLAAMVQNMVRLQIAEAEARILAHVDQKLAGLGARDQKGLKAEIREEVLEEIRREFE